MKIQKIRSSDLIKQLFGTIDQYVEIITPYMTSLIKKYPDKSLEKLFSLLNHQFIVITPMTLCTSLLKDLGIEIDKEAIAALGLHMLIISLHDDVVDKLPKDHLESASWVYAGNITSNEGSQILIKSGKTILLGKLLELINNHHYEQMNNIHFLWQSKPKTFQEYHRGIHQACVYSRIGLLYGLEIAQRMDLKEKITAYAEGYGVGVQMMDDLIEMEGDKESGYWSYPLVEGKPFKESFANLFRYIQNSRNSIPDEWKNLQGLINNLNKVLTNIKTQLE